MLSVVYKARASWGRLFLPGVEADPIWSEPKSAPGPQTSRAGATKKIVGSATLVLSGNKGMAVAGAGARAKIMVKVGARAENK